MRLRRLPRVIGLIIVALAAGIGTLEGGARWLVVMPDEFLRPDPGGAGIHHIAGREGRWVSSEFDVRVRINADGFRDRERATSKPPGTRRIVVLGDSITEALQVPLEETFAARVERHLTTAARPVEVLNLGISALGPAQEYLILREYGVRYAPDVVVLAVFTANDFRGSLAVLEGKPYLRYPRQGPDGAIMRGADGDVLFTDPFVPSPGRQWLRTHVASYRLIRDRVWRTAGGSESPAAADLLAIYREPPPSVWREAIDVTLAMVGDVDALARRIGAQLIVLVVPAPWEVDPRAREQHPELRGAAVDWGRPQRLLFDWLARHRIPTVTVSDAFAHEVAAGGRPYFRIDGHLTPNGHRLVADRLAAVLGDL